MAATTFFLPGLRKVLGGDINLGSDVLKVSILGPGFTFLNTVEFFDTGGDDANDPSFQLLTATNYADQVVTGLLSFFDILTGDGKSGISIPDVSFGSLGGVANDTISSALLWKDTGTPTTSPVIAWLPADNPSLTTGVNVSLDFFSQAEGGQFRIVLPSQA